MHGRLVSPTLSALQRMIADAQDMLGRIATFEETGGTRWRNCELVDFRPVSEYRRCVIGGTDLFTCEVTGTVETAGG
jgi:hypothetical protein